MMNKNERKDFFNYVGGKVGETGDTVENVTNGYSQVFVERSKAGEKMEIPGIGTFSAHHKPAGERNQYNPQTKTTEMKSFPAKTVVSFKIEKATMKKINE